MSDSAIAHYRKGLALRRLGRLEEALAAYDQALAIDPSARDIWMGKVAVLENLRRWNDALAAADRILALNPQDVYGWEHRAMALAGLGRWEEKLAAAQRAIALAPGYLPATYHLGIALHRLGRLEEAVRAYDQVLAAGPDNMEVWTYKAGALEALGRADSALAAWEHLIAIGPEDATYWLHKAAALEKLQRFQEALAAYDRALEILPDHEAARKQRDALQQRMTAASATATASVQFFRVTEMARQAETPAVSYRVQPAGKLNPPAQAGYQSIIVTRTPRRPAEPPERYKVGEKIGDRFEILAIHRGGMGVVYGTFDHEVRLPRALKTLQLRFAIDREMRELFAEEGAVWVHLEKHPYIVRAFLVQNYDGHPFVITEYVRGPDGMGSDLRSWLGHPRLTLPVAVEMALQIAQGMQHATRKISGMVHRDLKPANTLVDERGRAMVTDFGLTRAAEAGAGTPAYMAPEQWMGGALDQRTDIYAYGCILYEMFSGHRMFARESIQEWQAAHLGLRPVPISTLADVPAGLEEFVFRCLSKPMEGRPQTWDEVVDVCADWFHRLTGQPVVIDFSAYSLTLDELVAAGHSLMQLGKYAEMLDVCERLLAHHPNYREGMINKIAALDKLNRLDEALATIGQVLAANPRDVLALNSKAVVLGRLGRNEESLAAIEEALAINPRMGDAWYRKGRALDRLKRTADALAAYDQALTLTPRDVDTWICKCLALEELKRWEELVKAAEQTSAVNPVDERPWIQKGGALLALGRADAALAAYDHALMLNPKSTVAWIWKTVLFEKLERWNDALAAADRTIALDAKDTYGWRHRLYVLARVQNWTDLLAAVEKAEKVLGQAAFSFTNDYKARAFDGLKRKS